MKNPNIILLGIVSILMLVGVNASEVGHPAEEIGAGTFDAGDFTFQGNVNLRLDNEVFLSIGNTEGSAREWALVSTGSLGGMGTGKFSIFDRTEGISRLTIDTEGYVGINNIDPKAKLDVSGEIKVGSTGLECTSDTEGTIRYVSGTGFEFCDGTEWKGVGGSTSGGAILGYQEFSAVGTGTYTPTPGTTSILVQVTGGGGNDVPGGGGGDCIVYTQGGGGGTGFKILQASEFGSSVELTVGGVAQDSIFGPVGAPFLIGEKGGDTYIQRGGARLAGPAGGATGADYFYSGTAGSIRSTHNDAGQDICRSIRSLVPGSGNSYDSDLAGSSYGASNNPGIIRIWEYGVQG